LLNYTSKRKQLKPNKLNTVATKKKSMLKGLEIKNPTELEKDGIKKKDITGKYFPGYDSDSDYFHDDL